MSSKITYRFTLNGQDIESLGVSFSQVRSEAMIITVSTRIPEGGLILSGEGVLYVAIDGVNEEIIGKGQVSGFPIGMSGDEVSFDMICRRKEGFEEAIDAAYDALPEIWQPEPELVPRGDRRRAQGYVPFFAYVDPVSHEISFHSIHGDMQKAPHVMNGEGAPSGTSFLITADPSMNADPIKELVVDSVANWQQVDAKVLDYGTAAIGSLSTATPEEYVSAVDQVVIQGGGAYLFVGSTYRPSFNAATDFLVATRKAYVDSRTSILYPVKYDKLTVNNYLPPDINILTTISQMRNERLRLRFTMDHGPFDGRRAVEEYSLSEPELRFARQVVHPIAGGGRGFGRVETYPDSVHYLDYDDFGERRLKILQGIINRSFTQIVDASYCITIRIETTAEEVLKMKVGDRCVINDARLPNGTAQGRIALTSVVISNTATGVFEVECSTCQASSNTPNPNGNWIFSVQDAAEASPPSTQQIDALRTSNPFFFLEPDVENTNGRWDPYPDEDDASLGLVSQREIVEEINRTNTSGIPPIIDPSQSNIPEINDIRGRVKEFLPSTTLAIKLRDVGENTFVAESDHIINVNPFNISVIKGVG